MANNSKNRYTKKAERSHYQALTEKLDTKGSVKNTVIETGKDLVVGVIGGGLIGSAIGKPSLLVGLGVTGAGHFFGSRLVSLLGVGMMAANGFQSQSSVSGIDDNSLLGVKDRVLAFKNTFSQKLFLDKFLAKKADTSTDSTTVAGVGDLQYFNYANEIAGIEELNNVEDQIETSGMSRLQMSGIIGAVSEYDLPSIGGSQVVPYDLSDITDYNL